LSAAKQDNSHSDASSAGSATARTIGGTPPLGALSMDFARDAVIEITSSFLWRQITLG
jgi:hypothetical protein